MFKKNLFKKNVRLKSLLCCEILKHYVKYETVVSRCCSGLSSMYTKIFIGNWIIFLTVGLIYN